MAKPEQSAPIQRCPKAALYLEAESTAPGGRGVWLARVPAEHDIDDVLSPEYFGFHQGSKQLREGDVIDIEPVSGLWFTRVRVMALVPALQQVRVREMANMRQSYAARAPSGYTFKWKGGAARWAILRGTTEVDAGFVTQDEALARIEELIREKAA